MHKNKIQVFFLVSPYKLISKILYLSFIVFKECQLFYFQKNKLIWYLHST